MQNSPVFRVIDQALFHIVQADSLNPMGGAFQVAGLLAVKLHEGTGVFQDFCLGLHFAQEIGDPNLDAAVSADMDFIAGIHADYAQILDAGLGAVTWAAGNGDLKLGGGP